MGDSYQEWWTNEVSEKFKCLMLLMKSYCAYCLIFKVLMMVLQPNYENISHQLGVIIAVFFLSFLGKKLEQKSPYLQIVYVLCLTEITNVFCLHTAGSSLKPHEPIFLLASAIVLVCVQLSFIYSYPLTVLLFLKFEYQWYFHKIHSGEISSTSISTPYSAAIGAIIFYLYYKYFQQRYSFNSFYTNRLLEEARLKNSILLKLISDGLIVLSQSREVILQNENIEALYGRDCLHDTLSELCFVENKKFSSLTDSCCLMDEVYKCFDLDIGTEVTLGVTYKDSVHSEWRAKKILWVNDTVLIITSRDVNQLIELERVTTEHAVKQSLLRSVAHDLKAPSECISTFSQEILQNCQHLLSDEDTEQLHVVIMSSKMLLSLVRDILDYSKIVSGVFVITKTNCNIKRLVKECSDIVFYHIKKKNLELVIRIEPNASCFAYTDPLRFQQILLNLLSNAIKFTDAGFIEISVCSGIDNKFRVGVKDTGIGIAPESIDSLFNLFSTNLDSAHNPYGNGIGLNIANILAIELGNEPISVSSRVGEGSEFSFCIQATEEHPVTHYDYDILEGTSEEATIKLLGSLITSAGYHEDPAKLLIVDDNHFNLMILSNNLRGISHLQAISGQEAIKIVERKSLTRNFIKAILMDLDMPNMSGIEATRQIARLFEEGQIEYMPAVIGYSADSTEDARLECIESGMVSLLPKPSTPDAILSTINRYL